MKNRSHMSLRRSNFFFKPVAVNDLLCFLTQIALELRWKIVTQKTPKEEATYRTPGISPVTR